MIDLGIICHEGFYFRDIWNCLDFIVVSCAIFSFFFSGSEAAAKNLSTMKSLRVLRVLRPLKTINRVPKLKVNVEYLTNQAQMHYNLIKYFYLRRYLIVWSTHLRTSLIYWLFICFSILYLQ